MIDDPLSHRQGTAPQLTACLADARAQLLRLFDALEACLPPGLEVRYGAELNPPRWELGHIAWFEEFWIARNTQRLRGAAAAPAAARAAPWWPRADALYDSSNVEHTSRWQLDLPSAAITRRYAGVVRERTLALLREARGDDQALYFFRLVLAHEDMHREAWVYMAQHLGLDIAPALAAAVPAAGGAEGEVEFDASTHRVGSEGPGFAFDNELGAHEVELGAFTIDRAPVSWARFLPFVDDGGYDEPRWWSAGGWSWRRRSSPGLPRYLRRDVGGRWWRESFGRWLELDLAQPAVNVSHHEALAWCAWAGRRLASEAEWEHAVTTHTGGLAWGQVWEWTASAFAPYPGFTPHPYVDYSRPWFDGRPVLRGASFATAPRMKDPRYRNYFPGVRNDIFAGFRSCALSP